MNTLYIFWIIFTQTGMITFGHDQKEDILPNVERIDGFPKRKDKQYVLDRKILEKRHNITIN